MSEPDSSHAAIERLVRALRSFLDKIELIKQPKRWSDKEKVEAAKNELLPAYKEADLAALGIARHLEYGLGVEKAGPFETELRSALSTLCNTAGVPLFDDWDEHYSYYFIATNGISLLLSVAVKESGTERNSDSGDGVDELVTLSQVAPLVACSKRTLERYLDNKKIPHPDFPGGNGKPHKWVWRNLRPSLENHFNRILPERFPGSRII